MTPAKELLSRLDARTSGADGLEPTAGRIGDHFLQSGRLSEADIQRIARKQQESRLRFGDAAVALGLLSIAEVEQALARQYHYPTAALDAVLAGYPVAHAPHGPEAEAIRHLRTQIILKLDMTQARSIALMSPVGGEGKAYVAASLALAFAQNGQRTLLVNADLRQARHSGLLDSQRPQGLSSVLSGRHSLSQSLITPDFARLRVLDAGPLPPNPTELLLAPALSNMLAQAAEHFDVLILNTPPALRYPDAQLIARQVDACVIVTRQHQTLIRDVRRSQHLILSAGGRLLGTALNASPRKPPAEPASKARPAGWLRRLRGTPTRD
jgi:chain length determinant protein tyrosine kinase EpsG